MECRQKKEQYADESSKHHKNISRHYGSYLSGLEGRPSDVVCQKKISQHPVADTPTNVQLDGEYVSKRFHSFQIAFSNTLLQVSKQGDRQIAFELVKLLAATLFKTNVVKKHMKCFADCEDIFSRTTYAIMKDDGFHRVLVRGGSAKRNSHCKLYVSGVREILRGQAEFCGKGVILLRPEHKNAFLTVVSPIMSTDYI